MPCSEKKNVWTMNQKSDSSPHLPVMTAECLQFFADSKLKVFFDGTLGAGGHAKALLSSHPEIEVYIGCDQDPEALGIARQRLKEWEDKVEFVRGNFEDLDQILKKLAIKQVDGFFLT